MRRGTEWLHRVGRWRARMTMARHLANWREVWAAFQSGGGAAPPLRFRNGLVFSGRPQDVPILLFFEVFAVGCYRRLSDDAAATVIDVGANVGAFTIDWLHRHPRAIVHAYEPDADTYAVFRKNLDANGMANRVTIWNDAVTNHDGTVSFVRDSLSLGNRVGAGSLSVNSVSLETVLRRLGRPLDLLKIDAEGAEADILEGCPTSVPRVRRIIGEYHEALVPDVRERLEKALRPSHFCRFRSSRRCGSMFVATARAI